MVVDADSAVLDALQQKLLTALDLVVGRLRAPLERRRSLRYENGDRDGNRDAAALPLGNNLASELQHMVGKLGDGDDILIALAGKAHHEVELAPAPSGLERSLHGAIEVFLGDALVDHVAHALASGLWSEGETALLLPCDLKRHIDAERIEALRWNGDGDAGVLQTSVQARQDLLAA